MKQEDFNKKYPYFCELNVHYLHPNKTYLCKDCLAKTLARECGVSVKYRFYNVCMAEDCFNQAEYQVALEEMTSIQMIKRSHGTDL